MAVALPRNPAVADLRKTERDVRGLHRQRAHRRMFDLPASAHLLDDQFRVHPDLHGGVRIDVGRRSQARDQPLVLGDVVGRPTDRPGPFGQHLAGFGVPHKRSVPGRARIAP